jgi:hypothetical protein
MFKASLRIYNSEIKKEDKSSRRVPLVTSLPPQRRTHSSIPLDLNQMPYMPLIIPNALVVISSTFEDINQESVVVMVIYLIVIESRLESLIADHK